MSRKSGNRFSDTEMRKRKVRIGLGSTASHATRLPAGQKSLGMSFPRGMGRGREDTPTAQAAASPRARARARIKSDSRFQTADAPPSPAVVAILAAAVASRALRSFLFPALRGSPATRSSTSGRREGAKRREALVRIAAPLACHDAAREKHLTEVLRAPVTQGRSPLGASPRHVTNPGPTPHS